MEVQLRDIYKRFKEKEVLKGISFTIQEGTVCGLLGVNGAGKSTIMKLLFGLEKSDKGSILFDGKEPSGTFQVNHRIGALIETPAIYNNLSAFDNLKTRALLYDIADERITEVLDLVGLGDAGRKKAGSFSVGMKQRLGLGMAMLTNPDFLILDEPTNGLDPDGIKELLALILDLKDRGMTILVSSHQLHEVSKIADTIVILHDGEIYYNAPNSHDDNLEQLFFKIVHGGS